MDQTGRTGEDDVQPDTGERSASTGSSPTVTAEDHSADTGEDNGERAQPGAPASRASRWVYSAVTRHLAVLAGYLGAGILFTWPRITYLGNHELPNTRDAGAYVWGFWWIISQVEH